MGVLVVTCNYMNFLLTISYHVVVYRLHGQVAFCELESGVGQGVYVHLVALCIFVSIVVFLLMLASVCSFVSLSVGGSSNGLCM